MALARKCDRCGILYEPEKRKIKNNITFNSIELIERYLNNDYIDVVFIDLCPNCLDSFIEWLENESVSDI
nr:MAG TPA: Protein of unknown function (DUF983) [Caudoviricetes sp.]